MYTVAEHTFTDGERMFNEAECMFTIGECKLHGRPVSVLSLLT